MGGWEKWSGGLEVRAPSPLLGVVGVLQRRSPRRNADGQQRRQTERSGGAGQLRRRPGRGGAHPDDDQVLALVVAADVPAGRRGARRGARARACPVKRWPRLNGGAWDAGRARRAAACACGPVRQLRRTACSWHHETHISSSRDYARITAAGAQQRCTHLASARTRSASCSSVKSTSLMSLGTLRGFTPLLGTAKDGLWDGGAATARTTPQAWPRPWRAAERIARVPVRRIIFVRGARGGSVEATIVGQGDGRLKLQLLHNLMLRVHITIGGPGGPSTVTLASLPANFHFRVPRCCRTLHQGPLIDQCTHQCTLLLVPTWYRSRQQRQHAQHTGRPCCQ